MREEREISTKRIDDSNASSSSSSGATTSNESGGEKTRISKADTLSVDTGKLVKSVMKKMDGLSSEENETSGAEKQRSYLQIHNISSLTASLHDDEGLGTSKNESPHSGKKSSDVKKFTVGGGNEDADVDEVMYDAGIQEEQAQANSISHKNYPLSSTTSMPSQQHGSHSHKITTQTSKHKKQHQKHQDSNPFDHGGDHKRQNESSQSSNKSGHAQIESTKEKNSSNAYLSHSAKSGGGGIGASGSGSGSGGSGSSHQLNTSSKYDGMNSSAASLGLAGLSSLKKTTTGPPLTMSTGRDISTSSNTTASTSAMTTSFLEALSEEEKRTRTRYLPDVDGIRKLHKSEIKSDLRLARAGHQFRPQLFLSRSNSSSATNKESGQGQQNKSVFPSAGMKRTATSGSSSSSRGGGHSNIYGNQSNKDGVVLSIGNLKRPNTCGDYYGRVDLIPDDEDSYFNVTNDGDDRDRDCDPSTVIKTQSPFVSNIINSSTNNQNLSSFPYSVSSSKKHKQLLMVDNSENSPIVVTASKKDETATITTSSKGGILSATTSTSSAPKKKIIDEISLNAGKKDKQQQSQTDSKGDNIASINQAQKSKQQSNDANASINKINSITHTSAPPHRVQCLKTFDPPRPNESSGKKKKHRLCRWERNPSDIEADVERYRTVVRRTQEELRFVSEEITQKEYQHNLLRDHCLTHLRLLREEGILVNKRLEHLQTECVNEAQRQAQAANLGDVRIQGIRDAIRLFQDEDAPKPQTVVNVVTQDRATKKSSINTTRKMTPTTTTTSLFCGGIGGVTLWHNDSYTENTPALSSQWIVPGDRVRTPYGDGVVAAVLGGPNESFLLSKQRKSSSTKRKHGLVVGDEDEDDDIGNFRGHLTQPTVHKLSPRVVIRVSYGVIYFTPNGNDLQIITEDNHDKKRDETTTMTEDGLMDRWNAIYKSALSMKHYLDSQSMQNKTLAWMHNKYGARVVDDTDVVQPDDDPTAEEDSQHEHEHTYWPKEKRSIRFGSNLLLDPYRYGVVPDNMSMADIENSIRPIFYRNRKELSKKSKKHPVPQRQNFTELEDERFELTRLKSRVLQLRNELRRQQKVRRLNDASLLLSEERERRSEELLLEMKADLNSLKKRLWDELSELGICHDRAEEILIAHYKDFQTATDTERRPSKKQARVHQEDDTIRRYA